MDLDNITDIELLRRLLKKHMIQVKKSFLDDEGFVFHKGRWYDYVQDEYGVTVIAGEVCKLFDYNEVNEYLE